MWFAAVAVALVLSTCDGAALQKKEELCICTLELDPVCEKDGTWHPNPSCARCAGADHVDRAYCEDDNLPEIEPLEPDCVCTREYYQVCTPDGQRFSNPCMARCHGAVDAEHSLCESDWEIPKITPICECTLDYTPVCGSDGQTYGNSCAARCSGVEEYTQGPCGGNDDNPGDAGDDGDDYYPTEMCACPYHYAPVCGADGQTYGNSCAADCEGVEYTSGSCDGEWESKINQVFDSTGSDSDDNNYSDDADTDEDKKALKKRHPARKIKKIF